MKKSIDNALSEEEQRMVLQGLLSRKIWRFYELLSKWAPIPLMLWHWYGVWDYGHCPRPAILDTNDNGNCIIWIYFLAYIYMPLCMLPVSFFFRYCWIFRIPFFYFFRYQRYQTVLSALAHHSRAVGDAPCIYHFYINIICLWIYQDRYHT